MANEKTTPKRKIQTKYDEIKYRCDQPVRMVGKYTAEDVRRTYTEDFLDEHDGQIHSIERHETIIHRGQEITKDMVPQILFWMQAGDIKDILVSNQRRDRDPYVRSFAAPYIVSVRLNTERASKLVIQATSLKMAINIAGDWAEQTGSGTYEIVYAKLANDLIIIEDSLRKLERLELQENADPMDRDPKAEQKEKEEQEAEENNPANRFYQIDAKVTVIVDDQNKDIEVPRSFLVRVPDADLAKVLITKWIRKNLKEKGIEEEPKITLVLDEAVIFNCNKVIPREFTDEYRKHEDQEALAEKILYMSNEDMTKMIERELSLKGGKK